MPTTTPIVPSIFMLALAVATPLAALDSHVAGPRALGLGGAGTAAADDTPASYYNPALYGFFGRTGEEDAMLASDPNHLGRKDWGVGLVDLGVSAEVRGRLADFVEQLADTDLDRLADLGGASPTAEDLKTAMATLGLIEQFTPARDTIVAATNVGVLNLRIGRFGIGVRQYGEAVVSIADLDRTRIGLGTDTPLIDIGTEITAPSVTPAGWTSGHTPTLLTGGLASNVFNALVTDRRWAMPTRRSASWTTPPGRPASAPPTWRCSPRPAGRW
jgi:hypothetical protein